MPCASFTQSGEGRNIPGPAWMTAEDVASRALEATRSGRPWLVPGTFNKVAVAVAGPVPRGVMRRVAARVASRV